MIEERLTVKAETRTMPDGPGDEAYRLLRSTVRFTTGERPVRSVLVVDIDRATSSDVARRLAESFSMAGDRCVLVETDSRGGTKAAGFSDLIDGASLDGIAVDSEAHSLAVISAGRATSADTLSADGVDDALSKLLERFEHVILTCAPMPQFADALALAPLVDAVILVVSSGKTRRQKAIDARDALRRVGANILGAVLSEEKRGRFR